MVGQPIGWTDISSQFAFPPGISVYRGERATPALKATYIDVGPANSKVVVYPYLSGAPAGKDPTFLAVVYADSAGFPRPVLYEKTLDADDKSSRRFSGPGWFTSANPGYWGGTPAWLNPVGDGSSSARFMLRLPAAGAYEAQAWWVASSNRATNTPFIIARTNGADTVRMDQTSGGSRWNVLGTYGFSGDTSESITVTNAATGGNYVVADGIRIVSYTFRFRSGDLASGIYLARLTAGGAARTTKVLLQK